VILKIISLFLVVIAILGMFGKWRIPKLGRTKLGKLSPAKCPSCGRYRIGRGRCGCGAGGRDA
jgi:hypothetical protein